MYNNTQEEFSSCFIRFIFLQNEREQIMTTNVWLCQVPSTFTVKPFNVGVFASKGLCEPSFYRSGMTTGLDGTQTSMMASRNYEYHPNTSGFLI